MLTWAITALAAALLRDGLASSEGEAQQLARGLEMSYRIEPAGEALHDMVYALDDEQTERNLIIDYSASTWEEGYARLAEDLLQQTGLDHRDRVLVLGWIWLPGECRHQGYGSMLMEQLEGEARRQGASAVVLYAAYPSSKPRLFYRSIGFTDLYRTQHGAALMYKRL